MDNDPASKTTPGRFVAAPPAVAYFNAPAPASGGWHECAAPLAGITLMLAWAAVWLWLIP